MAADGLDFVKVKDGASSMISIEDIVISHLDFVYCCMAKNDKVHEPNTWGEIEIDNSCNDDDFECFMIDWL